MILRGFLFSFSFSGRKVGGMAGSPHKEEQDYKGETPQTKKREFLMVGEGTYIVRKKRL